MTHQRYARLLQSLRVSRLNWNGAGTVSRVKSDSIGTLTIYHHVVIAAMDVNWCKITISREDTGIQIYKKHLFPILRSQRLLLKPLFEIAALVGRLKTKTIMCSKRKTTI